MNKQFNCSYRARFLNQLQDQQFVAATSAPLQAPTNKKFQDFMSEVMQANRVLPVIRPWEENTAFPCVRAGHINPFIPWQVQVSVQQVGGMAPPGTVMLQQPHPGMMHPTNVVTTTVNMQVGASKSYLELL